VCILVVPILWEWRSGDTTYARQKAKGRVLLSPHARERAKGYTQCMVRSGLAVVLLALVAAGCSDEHNGLKPPPSSPGLPSMTVGELLSSPESLLVDGSKISIQISLNRDFFPESPPEGRPMTAYIVLNGFPPGSVPESAAVYLWAIRDSVAVWGVTMDVDGIDQIHGGGTYHAWQGPLWDPGILVDVVIGVRTSPVKVSYVLLRNVLIEQSA